MDVLEAIHTRRSIRKYTGEPVSDAQVEILLRAAMAAPSAGNQQPWRFVVVRDRAQLEAAAAAHPYAKMAPHAALAILVCGDTRKQKYEGYWVIDCAAAVQNLLLAAHAQGLGAVWTGVYPSMDRVEALAKIFACPKGVIPHSFIPIGRPAEVKGREDRYDPARVAVDRF
jgi:nitroreductase